MNAPAERPPGRIARGRERVRVVRRTATDRVAALRSTSTYFDAVVRAWEYDSEIGGGLMAGALAFRLFMFMVPFTVFGFTVLSLLGDLLGLPPRDMANRAGIGGVVAKGVVNVNSLSTGSRLVLLVIVGYALIAAGRSVIRTIVDAYCLIWRMPRLRIARTRAALVFVGFVVAYGVLSTLLSRLRAIAPAPGFALTVAAIAVPLLAWLWASATLPRGAAPVWALIPGAATFAVGVELIHLFTVYWVAHQVTQKSETYGVIGISLTVLLWAYIAGRLVTGTAVVNATLWRRFEETHVEAIEEVRRDHQSAESRTRLVLAWIRSAAGLFR
ncbi:MAG: YhjD/YihY/BrkB family envelope integrity protein [Actinomycetes bacterium]